MGNSFWDRLQGSVLNNDANWLEKLYGQTRAEQQQALRGVFTVVDENTTLTGEQANQMNAKAEDLKTKVLQLEAKMAVLEEQIAEKQDEIDKHASEIEELILQSERASQTLEENQKKAVKTAIKDTFDYFERHRETSGIKPDQIPNQIRIRLQNNATLQADQAALNRILGNLGSKEEDIKGLTSQIAGWMDQKDILEAQYGATKSTYDLLKASANQLGPQTSSYTNSDFDDSVPVYSPEQVALISKYSENANINVEATNTNYVEGSTAPANNGATGEISAEKRAEIDKKYEGLLGTETTAGVDSCSYNNVAVQNLEKALNMNGDGTGLIEDLSAAGMNYTQIADFLAKNFEGARILKTNDGNITIPFGHGDKAPAVYNKLNEKMQGLSAAKIETNTWDKNAGNTLESNEQLNKLFENDNYATILNDMKEHGFTFKEAMYAMFNPDSGIFKDCGIIYNPKNQTGTPNYTINNPGDLPTQEKYHALSKVIYDNWGVKPSGPANIDPERKDPSDPGPSEIQRTDPIYFNINENKDEKYTFVIDRNGDGKFNGPEEFVGGQEGTTWLEDLQSLDANQDGKLSDDELKNLQILGTKFEDGEQGIDNNEYTPDINAVEDGFVRESETKISYSFNNAQAFGISEINLENLEGNVGQDTGVLDANGNQKFNDSFNFTMGEGEDAQTIEAHRLDETDSYMNTVYGDIKDKNFKQEFTAQDVDTIIDKDYGEYAAFDQWFGGYGTQNPGGDINTLLNFDALRNEANVLADEAIQNAEDYTNLELRKADNKAVSYKNVTGWDQEKGEIFRLASSAGFDVNDLEVRQQLEGIWIINPNIDAQGVVDKYQAQVDEEAAIENKSATRKTVAQLLVFSAQTGAPTTVDEIRKWLQEGKTVDEIKAIIQERADNDTSDPYANVVATYDQAREDEIQSAFLKVFDEAGHGDKAVEALALLCEMQREDTSIMPNRSGEELAQMMLEEMGL